MRSQHLQPGCLQLMDWCTSLSSRQQLLLLLLLLLLRSLAQLRQPQPRQKLRRTCKLRWPSCRQLLAWQLCKRRLPQLRQQWSLLVLLALLVLAALLPLQAAMLEQPGWMTSSTLSRRGTWGNRLCLPCSLQGPCGVGMSSRRRPLAWQHCRACQWQQLEARCSRLGGMVHLVVFCQACRSQQLQLGTSISSSSSSRLAYGAAVWRVEQEVCADG
jgi:hypothetical protein